MRCAIIDPGGDVSKIEAYIELLGVEPETILITHGHFDHCGGAARLAELTGARIEGPHAGDSHLVAQASELGEQLGHTAARSYDPSRWLEDGDTIRFGQEKLQVLHCPGHCRGHVAYFSAAARWAFVGDILFRGAIGAWDHRDGDLKLLLDSIRNKLFALGDDIMFVPGHGPTSSFGRERRENPFVGDEAIARFRRSSKRDPLQASVPDRNR